jgi:hypothetical protein
VNLTYRGQRARLCALALAIALPASVQAQSSIELEARRFPARILAAHNVERAANGLAPLKWDAALGTQAAKYAVQLALSRRFAHSASQARGGSGENLWMGTRWAFTVEAMVGGWASEKRMFTPGVFPAVSRTGNWAEVGHYTQMVWPATERVGCALASNSGEDYLVCHYWPAGNVHGGLLQPRLAALRTRR